MYMGVCECAVKQKMQFMTPSCEILNPSGCSMYFYVFPLKCLKKHLFCPYIYLYINVYIFAYVDT